MKRFLALAGALVLAFGFAVPAVLAADPSLPQTGRVLVSTGGDFTLPAGEHADVVVVVNGTATINGEANTIVVVDGTAILNAARTETLVAVRTPVTIGADTVVLGDVMTFDSQVKQLGNAEIQGSVRDIAGGLVGVGLVLGPAMFLLFIGFAIVAIAAGLLLAALAAKQVRAAGALISHEPVQTLVAGLAGIVLPVLLIIALFVTIVGAPLAFAIMFGLWPLTAFLGYLVAGIWIGDVILSRATPEVVRERPYLAAVIGLIVLEVAVILPPLSAIASLFGYGAVLLFAWRTIRLGSAVTAPAARSAPVSLAGGAH